ncbi:MAG: CHAT domain-containing protein [Ferruginibacter sp.]
MKLQFKKYYLCALFLMAGATASAQSPVNTEEKELYFKIYYVYRANDTNIAFISDAQGLGIKKGHLINSFQAYSSKKNAAGQNRKFTAAGTGKIAKADSIIAAMVKLFSRADSLEKGDLISIRLNIPQVDYRGIFSDLAFNQIYFVNLNDKSFYGLKNILYTDNKQTEDSLYSVFLDDLHGSYISLKDREDIKEMVNKKITGGRFAGKTYLDLLRDVTRQDLESFLLFVNAYPDNYRGNNYRLNETFVTWALNNAPYSHGEVKKALFPVYKNKEKFLKQLSLYKSSIIEDNFCLQFIKDVEKLITNDKFTEASAYNDFIKTVAYAVNDTAGKSLAWVMEAEINHKQDRYEIAVIQCDSAIKYAAMSNQHEYELAAISKKIFCFTKLLRFSQAKDLIREFEIKIEAYKSTLLENVYNSNRQKRYEYEGSMFYAEGNYELALKSYKNLVELNKGINSLQAQVKNAQYLAFIGRVNNDQGKPAEALEAFIGSARTYRLNYDTLNWAKVQNDMAYSYYKLANYSKCMALTDSAMYKLLLIKNYNDAGYSKSLKGSCYWELGKYDSAVMAHKESIGLRKKANNLSGQAHSWKSIGELYLLSGQKNQALVAYDSAAGFYRQLKDSSGLAETYNKKGNVFYNDENNKKAVEFFEKANGINSKATVEALYNLGNAWYDMDSVKARNYFIACSQLSESTKNTAYFFDATRSLANLAYRTGNPAAGDTHYEACLGLSKQLNTAQSYGDCLSLKAYGYKTQSRLDSAMHYYNLAMQVFDTVSQSGVIWQLNSIAELNISMGNFPKAKEALNKAIQLAQASNNSIALGTTLEATSFLYGLTGEFEEGLKNSDSALAIFGRSGNVLRLANTYLSRGTLYKSMGAYNKSINAFLLADSIYIDQQAVENRSVVSTNIGVTYFTQQDYVNALKYHRLALDQLKKGIINESYLLGKGNIAEDLFYLKKYKEAEADLLEVFPVTKDKKMHRVASGMALSLGKLYYETKQTDKSISYFDYAAEYANSSGEKEKAIEALTYLGQINKDRGKTENAENDFRKAVNIVIEYHITLGWEPFYQLGQLFYAQNKYDSALQYFKKAVELLDKNSENLYGGEEARKIFNNDPKKSDLYNKITFSYYNLGNINDAWAYANRSNIAGIKELSGTLSSSSNNEEKNEALKKLLAMQQSKKALESTLEKQEGSAKEETLKKIEIVEANYNNFLEDVVGKYPELSIYFSRSNADEFNNYKSKLPEDVAVLLYLLNNNTLMIFSLTREKLSVDTMTVDIGPAVNTFIEAIKNTSKQTGTGPLALRSEPVDEDNTAAVVEFKDLSGHLYKTLISTVLDKISGKKKLCIIPTGVFSNLPFQCLGKKTPGNKFRFLIEDHNIFYTNKMSVFNSGDKEIAVKTGLQSFAAFGVPDATLQFNIGEVKEIGKILGSDSTVYADARATESLAKISLRQKKYIHFATHGVLNYSSDYSQSYLKLLPDKDTSNGNNGQLTMREIQSLGITDCNMVILSACQTAVSKQLVKGWNISPANSFLVSNVKTVVASLWKVADEPTGLLMQYFYENLSLPVPMEKAEALRQAQVKLSQSPRFSHPNYWGAFVLYGDWR